MRSIMYDNMLASAGQRRWRTWPARPLRWRTAARRSIDQPRYGDLDGADGLLPLTLGTRSTASNPGRVHGRRNQYLGPDGTVNRRSWCSATIRSLARLGAYEVQVPRVLATGVVSTSGADVVSAGAASRPFQSIAYALTQAADSGTVKVAMATTTRTSR